MVFEEFDNVYVSFSGGKDSGLLLNLVMDYRRKYFPWKTVGIFHQDFEAQYTVTTEYVERTFERYRDEAELYWVCLPMATRTALSSYEMYWYPWDDTKEELWVRPMPDHDYVINLSNNPIIKNSWRAIRTSRTVQRICPTSKESSSSWRCPTVTWCSSIWSVPAKGSPSSISTTMVCSPGRSSWQRALKTMWRAC